MFELQQDIWYDLADLGQAGNLSQVLTDNLIFRRYKVMAKPTLAKNCTKLKSSRIIDLTGQRFGKLKIIEIKGKDKQQNLLWLCKCDCGNTKIANSKSLRAGGTKSCGCGHFGSETMRIKWADPEFKKRVSKKISQSTKKTWSKPGHKEERSTRPIIDLTSQRFGKLIAIKQEGLNSQGNALWLCQCDCGNTKVIASGRLRSGKTRSCGCLRFGKIKSEETRKKISEAAKKRWSNPEFKAYITEQARKRQPEPTLCACGCGELAKSKNKYIHGHNAMSNHPMQGKKHSEETRRKIRESYNGWSRGEGHPMYGKKHSEETCKKMSKSRTGVPLSESHRKNITIANRKAWDDLSDEQRAIRHGKMWEAFNGNSPMKGKKQSVESRRKMSESRKGVPLSESHRKNITIANKKAWGDLSEEQRAIRHGKMWGKFNGNSPWEGKHHTEKAKQKLREIHLKLWQDPAHARKHLVFNSPNKSEIKLMGYINEVSPVGWEFVGDGKVVIDGKCPDFINKNSLQVIELFGEFWHKTQEEKTRKDFFAQYGYETLIVWCKELYRPVKLRQKLKAFCCNDSIPALQKEDPR